MDNKSKPYTKKTVGDYNDIKRQLNFSKEYKKEIEEMEKAAAYYEELFKA